MDINNLLQTIIFMNIKDIGKMSYIELFPIILFSLFQSYKDVIIGLFDINKIKNKFYTSEIITKVIFNDNGMKSIDKSAITLLWLYLKDIRLINKCKKIKEYKFFCSIKRNEKNDYIYDHYIPSENCMIELVTNIYLEFIHSTQDKKISNKNDNDKEEVVKEYIVTLKLKSKKLNNEELIYWLSEKVKEYDIWFNIDKNLYIYTSFDEKQKLDFNRFIFSSTKTFDNLFFEGKELIIERLEKYKNIKKYEELGIPHSLGFLFYGEPGCGKTSCIKAIAKYLKRNIITINLNHIQNIDELKTLFLSDDITGWSCNLNKRIYVFEEVDCFQDEDNPFLDRELKIKKEVKDEKADNFDKFANMLMKEEKSEFKRKPKLTTGEVLELLDGIAESEDRIIIFTTNHPEKIDKAFMRPGRIDISINFKKLRRQDINSLYKLWFNRGINEKTLNKIKDYSISQADFGKLCFENNAESVMQKLLTI